MPASFEIVTDSSCNLTEEMIDALGVHVLPLTFMADGEETVYQSYLKGERTDLSQFYAMMRSGKVFKTSLPNLADSEALFRSLLDQGRDILYIGFSSALSGTFESTNLLLSQLSEDYPERTIRTVDTLCASGGQGLIVWQAAQRALEGENFESVYTWTEEHKLKADHWFTVDDLMFLFRGGRLSKTSAWAGTLLNIKPVMHINNEGRLVPLEKVRSRKKSLTALVDRVEKTIAQPVAEQTIFITHGDCAEEAQQLSEAIRKRIDCKNIFINCIDPVIGAHSGPGTLGVFFMAEGRE